MQEFKEETEREIEALLVKHSELYEKGNIPDAGECLIKAYEIIPDKKEEYNESYNYCSYVLNYILEEHYKLNEAEEWLKKLHKIEKYQKCWSGDYAFFAGKTYFELKNFILAKKFFESCVKEGKGTRYFKDEDPKYLDFYKNPKKYME